MGKYTDPDWEHSALVTIDTQNDFTLPGAPSEIAGTAKAVVSTAAVFESFALVTTSVSTESTPFIA